MYEIRGTIARGNGVGRLGVYSNFVI